MQKFSCNFLGSMYNELIDKRNEESKMFNHISNEFFMESFFLADDADMLSFLLFGEL